MDAYEKQMTGFQNLYHITKIPFIIATPTLGVVRSFPEGSDIFYQSDYWVRTPMGDIKDKHPDSVTLFEVGEFCYVAIIKLDVNLFLTTVPVRNTANFPHSYFPVLQQGIKEDMQVDFYRMLLDVPPMTTYQLAEFASLAKMIYCNEPADGIQLQRYTKPDADNTLSKTVDYLLTMEDIDAIQHVSMDYEEKIKEGITAGNISATEDALNRSLRGMIGRMSLNDLRQSKYQFICMMYASCRAAIAGGAPQEYCFHLSDLFCQRMDGLTDIIAINKYSRECILSFCQLVAQNKHKNDYSSYTKATLDYISQHLLEPLTTKQISISVGLNRKSLGIYFKKDTGITIPKYIQNRRLEEAAYLLQNSSMTISDISELLQFSNQSHFTERFKDKYHVTPMTYRHS